MFWDREAGVYHRKLQTVFLDAGYSDVQIILADGRIPCAVAVMMKTGR